jgi:diguanylate cyclase (GGDEF)-like protein
MPTKLKLTNGNKNVILAVKDTDSIAVTTQRMWDKKIGCLLVNNKEGRLAGIVTERDIVRATAAGLDLNKTAVADIMTKQVISCSPDTTPRKAREIMVANHIRHLPIADGDIAMGIFSIRDVTQHQILEDRMTAEKVLMMSACLKSIDLERVIENITTEVPKLFEAQRCVLYLSANPSDLRTVPFISRNNCTCPYENLEKQFKKIEFDDTGALLQSDVSEDCCIAESKCPRLLIPLSIAPEKNTENKKAQHQGYLCMCGLDELKTINKDIFNYKVKLVRETLVAHLTNAWQYHNAQTASLIDALTKTGSRRYFEDKLKEEYNRAKRYNRPFSVAIIDLDYFKTINDTLGHAAGDEALKKLADCMNRCKRSIDIMARYGGDEFVIIMPETTAKDAAQMMERLRTKVPKIENNNHQITISCGVAERLPQDEDSGRQLMQRADLALYEAKRAGRNRVKIWNKTMSNLQNTNNTETKECKQLQESTAEK